LGAFSRPHCYSGPEKTGAAGQVGVCCAPPRPVPSHQIPNRTALDPILFYQLALSYRSLFLLSMRQRSAKAWLFLCFFQGRGNPFGRGRMVYIPEYVFPTKIRVFAAWPEE